MNLNIRAKQQSAFDAIVVGSGIRGGWAAKELCEKGLKELLLERGRPWNIRITRRPPPIPGNRKLRPPNPRRQARSPIQNRHYSYQADNKHFYINDWKSI